MAQFNMPNEEVNRWFQQNAPRQACRDIHHLPTAEAIGSTPYIRSSSSSSDSTACSVSRSLPVPVSPACRPQQLLPQHPHPHPHPHPQPRLAQSHGGTQHALEQSEDAAALMLHNFEDQVNWVTQQAAYLRRESHRLAQDGLLDQNRLESLNRLLGLASTADDSRAALLGNDALAKVPIVSAVSLTPPIFAEQQLQSNCGRQRRRNHAPEKLSVLVEWFDAHSDEPYPTPEEKSVLSKQTGMAIRQIEHWFTNRRKRHWRNADPYRVSPDTKLKE